VLPAAGLPDDVTLHTLRHTFASNLIASGCDVVTVQRALGHAQPSITLNVYSHLWPSAEDRTRAATAAFMASVADSADSLRTEIKKPQVRG
jgi:site-specific recombinase XerD